MKDMQVQLEKLRTDAAECELIRDLATDPHKRELFTRLAEHLNLLASYVEAAMANAGPASLDARLGRTAREPFSNESAL